MALDRIADLAALSSRQYPPEAAPEAAGRRVIKNDKEHGDATQNIKASADCILTILALPTTPLGLIRLMDFRAHDPPWGCRLPPTLGRDNRVSMLKDRATGAMIGVDVS
jgi:hypothetical protein